VVSLEQISKNKPVNIGIVFDHSGSMQLDQAQLFDNNGNPLFSFDSNGQPILPVGYSAPIDNAKSAVKTFAQSFNSRKDFISVIGFSDRVDRVLPLTNDISKVSSIVDSMNADFSTALYDAMIEGIDKIKIANGVKVLVVLTDGQDNSYKFNWSDVIAKANQLEIPIYIIGLGDVNKDTLLHNFMNADTTENS
jgi:Ca-activated chloride channel family protein